MGLMGTLTKVAMGYAAARGVDAVRGNGALARFTKQLTGSDTPDAAADTGGLLAQMQKMQQTQGGAGLAGLVAAASSMMAAGQDNFGDMIARLGGGGMAAETEAQAGLMLRAMIQSAKSDGRLDEAEQERILQTLGEDAEESDITFVRTQLAAPVDIPGLAADTPPAQAPQVYAMSLMSIRVDTDAERVYLRALAAELGLSPEMVGMLHTQMGAPPP